MPRAERVALVQQVSVFSAASSNQHQVFYLRWQRGTGAVNNKCRLLLLLHSFTPCSLQPQALLQAV